MLTDYDIKSFSPNILQLKNIFEKPNGATIIAGRRSGKTTLIAWIMKTIAHEMPRSSWPIVGQTYTDMMKNTLPTVVGALEDLGIYRGKDYFFGRKAPDNWKWPEPFRPLLKTDEAFWWRTGTVFPLVSLDRESSNRGPCFNGIICDEGLNLKRERFERETAIANSGDVKRWSHIPYHHATFIFSSMPYLNGQWLLEHGNYYNEDNNNYDQIWRQIHKLEIELVDNDDLEFRQATWEKIKKLRLKIHYYKNKSGFLYTEANVFDNLKNIGLKKILEFRKGTLDLNFRIEVLNEKLALNEESFYPQLNEDKHFYTAFNEDHIKSKLGEKYDFSALHSMDCQQDINVETNYDPDRPLEIAWDIGAAINYLVISQDFYEEIRIIHSMWVKSPEILDHLFRKFCEYYKPHRDKTVYFWYDPTGNSSKDNSIYTSAEQAMQILSSEGWDVIQMTTWGSNTYHEEKFQLINKVLLGDDDRYPKIMINTTNNKDLILSIKNTGVKQGFKGFKKDKSSESSKSIPREHATDGSDAFDILIYGKLKPIWDSIDSISPITM